VRESDRQDLGGVTAKRFGISLGHVVIRLRHGEALRGQNLRQGGRKRRLAVVDVTDRANVDVRLLALELFLGHRDISFCASLNRDLLKLKPS
jgi:hypothetical protein